MKQKKNRRKRKTDGGKAPQSTVSPMVDKTEFEHQKETAPNCASKITAPHDKLQIIVALLQKIQHNRPTTKDPLPKIESKVFTHPFSTGHTKNLTFLKIFTFQTKEKIESLAEERIG